MSKLDWRSGAEKAYAKGYGWKVARRSASLEDIAEGRRNSRRGECASEQLRDLFDHATFYDYAGTGRPAAIIVHPYGGHFTQAQVDSIARQYGLRGQIIQPTMYPHPDAQTIVFWKL